MSRLYYILILKYYCVCHRPPYGDFSPANLAKVTDSIQLNLFDELTVDLLQVYTYVRTMHIFEILKH